MGVPYLPMVVSIPSISHHIVSSYDSASRVASEHSKRKGPSLSNARNIPGTTATGGFNSIRCSVLVLVISMPTSSTTRCKW